MPSKNHLALRFQLSPLLSSPPSLFLHSSSTTPSFSLQNQTPHPCATALCTLPNIQQSPAISSSSPTPHPLFLLLLSFSLNSIFSHYILSSQLTAPSKKHPGKKSPPLNFLDNHSSPKEITSFVCVKKNGNDSEYPQRTKNKELITLNKEF